LRGAVERRDFRLKEAHLLTDLRGARERARVLPLQAGETRPRQLAGTYDVVVARDMEEPLKSLLGYAQYLRARLNAPRTSREL